MRKNLLLQVQNILAMNKKRIFSGLMVLVILGVLIAGGRTMFRVNGVVTGIDNNSITVADFFRTQTVDFTGSPVDISSIKPGDRVKIKKNIQGTVLYAQVSSLHDGAQQPRERHHKRF